MLREALYIIYFFYFRKNYGAGGIYYLSVIKSIEHICFNLQSPDCVMTSDSIQNSYMYKRDYFVNYSGINTLTILTCITIKS